MAGHNARNIVAVPETKTTGLTDHGDDYKTRIELLKEAYGDSVYSPRTMADFIKDEYVNGEGRNEPTGRGVIATYIDNMEKVETEKDGLQPQHDDSGNRAIAVPQLWLWRATNSRPLTPRPPFFCLCVFAPV
ncbi:hypothetical protein DL766_010139 [Monosporascus sp. MC13-8B]|uniref:Uncharacterized protein n=1 Tax=Monosporascus cannonballus TaxID=155416 RepID=A0ABY0HG39_9PEZI|nr:hypothetical protein DL762_001557 [Monosporascus cannonballus]RYO94642.1 hypothetical protein DL763_004009 [Monosporascus cannonballus]RYP09519.1 hypothetical protein DL766_010139 [Monosporascus sp. MC13-8B]